MKKVNTVTFHKADNYGAVLQAYALQKVLQRKYDSKILDYDCKYISNDYKLFKKTNSLKKQVIQFAKDAINYKKNKKRIINFNKFRKLLDLTESYNSPNEFLKQVPVVDAYVTGSDQVWNPKLTGGLDDVYTLNFKKENVKKISYAASSGSVDALKEDGKLLTNILDDYLAISVREKTLQKYLAENTNKDVELVLDPTLLLFKDEWLNLISTDRLIKEKYIFVYCGNEPDYFYDIVNDIAKSNDYTIVYFGRRDSENKFKYRKKSMYEAGPLEFINLLYNSEMVITASFHGTAFATILNKKLVAVLNKYSDRIKSLLTQLKLDDCIVTSYEEYKDFKPKYDWEVSNNELKNRREASIKWLYDSVEK